MTESCESCKCWRADGRTISLGQTGECRLDPVTVAKSAGDWCSRWAKSDAAAAGMSRRELALVEAAQAVIATYGSAVAPSLAVALAAYDAAGGTDAAD